VELAQTQAEIEAMPNGTELLSIYVENDIETYRDALYFVAQVLGGWNCANMVRSRLWRLGRGTGIPAAFPILSPGIRQ